MKRTKYVQPQQAIGKAGMKGHNGLYGPELCKH